MRAACNVAWVVLLFSVAGCAAEAAPDIAPEPVASQTLGLKASGKIAATNPLSSRLAPQTGSAAAAAQHAAHGLGQPFKVSPLDMKKRIIVDPTPDTGLVIPHWTGSFKYQGTTYPYSVIGADPALGQTTTIPTFVIPYRLVFADGTVFDATSDVIDGMTPLQAVMSSPVFQPAQFNSGSTSLGLTQWSDAVMRAEFWDRIPKQDGYHVLLAPTVLPAVTINVPADKGYTYIDSGTGRPIGEVSYQWAASTLALETANLGIAPDALSIHLFSEVAEYTLSDGGALGFHWSIDPTGSGHNLTFIETGYFGATLSSVRDYAAGTAVLGHEVAEWLMDPNLYNIVPAWQLAGFDHVCFNPLMEVADPIEDLPVLQHVPLNGAVYNLPDVALLPYFTHKQSTQALNGGWQTMLNTFTAPSLTCSLTQYLVQGFWFGPGTTTALTGVNNTKTAVGYLIAGGLYALRFNGFDPVDNPLAPFDVVNPPIPGQPGVVYPAIPGGVGDDGMIVGTYFDSGTPHGFIDQGGQYTTIDVPGALATSLNGLNNRAHRDIVGQYVDAQSVAHGFVLHDGQFTTVDVPFGINTSVNAINDQRQIVGSYESDGAQVGFQAVLPASGASDKASGFVAVTSPAGFVDQISSTQLLAVSNQGDIIGSQQIRENATGYVYERGFKITNGVFQFLGAGSDIDGSFYVTPNAVNDRGVIVGTATDLNATFAVNWAPWGLFNFDFNLDPSPRTVALPANHPAVMPLN